MSREKTFSPRGHLEIYKVFEDSTPDELIFDEDNTITSGLSVGLSILFSDLGSQDIRDYQIRWFQLGVSGDPADYGTSTNTLASPLTAVEYESDGSRLIVSTHDQLINGSTFNNKVFAQIPFHSIQKATPTSIKFTIGVDKNSCNAVTPLILNEIGLFMQNPRGQATKESILVAYRPFSNIVKTDEFALRFEWTISF